jgi:hypothetical protein
MSGSQAHARKRGIALLAVLLMTLFLGALGSALLALTVVDLRIGENHETSAKLLYLAEAGIDYARALLEDSPRSLSQWLSDVAGPDGALATARDPDIWAASDDLPLLGWRPIILGEPGAGEYSVFLGNDVADGEGSLLDRNRTVRILGIGRLAGFRKSVSAVVTRSGFPQLNAGITTGNSPGLDFRLLTPNATERLVDGILASATTIHNPAWNGSVTLASIGGPQDYPVTVVNGDAVFGPGVGYGVLVVRGELCVEGAFEWHGLILVIGQGTMCWPSSAMGNITGAVFISRTRAPDRDAANPLGSLLPAVGTAVADFTGSGTVSFDGVEIDRANAAFPFVVIASREHL